MTIIRDAVQIEEVHHGELAEVNIQPAGWKRGEDRKRSALNIDGVVA